jgi:NAD(P)-dependent dehydrogenase (short-subunit alcohol dehydrogenase family)
MTKAFLPLLKKQAVEGVYKNSRIVNIISMAGMLSGSGLAFSPYEMAKNAAEAFTDALRLEMKMFGIYVVGINPSFHGTPLVSNIRDEVMRAWEKLPVSKKREYGKGKLGCYPLIIPSFGIISLLCFAELLPFSF